LGLFARHRKIAGLVALAALGILGEDDPLFADAMQLDEAEEG
jgi:hypothetical protein